ncbi:MAG: 4Fe-4S dicluster domain-containing protein [Gammaproteobacteria bacterium]|nr:4Fe-4S dicluster domain-containing protein [Gammaproteobacteria bacterium]MDH5730664.1 4Fe-4S dicluster domain-containing protein [Gammaproteobacteria bacterium]
MSLKNILENFSDFRRDAEVGGHHDYEHRWAMSIDLNLCIGCNACSTACYAENNLGIVGKEKFEKGQAMHWLRVERYWDETDGEFPEQGASFVPMMCQQCGAATCEPVCPVAATYHTPDGLNAQVYNRCIGSRYCSNNCPFRVRYFNFWSYYEQSWPEPLNQQLNPDLSVRDKGVMEKCTFCVQRIRTAKDTAQREKRQLQDQDFVTACAQACPTNAITFGDTLDPNSKVSKAWRKHQVERGPYTHKKPKENAELRGYRVFEELNVDPSIMYLERVRETEV